MTYVDARDALVAYLVANWPVAHPTIPVYYENQETVDLDTVGDAFLKIEITYPYARQSSVELKPMTRVDGLLMIDIWARAGTGTRGGMVFYDYLHTLFAYKNLSGVQIAAPTQDKPAIQSGWHQQQMAIPFVFHIMS